jgi:hypothetical protein
VPGRGADAPAKPPRVAFETALSRSSRVLHEIAPRLAPLVGPEPRPSFRVIQTLDAIATALLPPHDPPELTIDVKQRGLVVLSRAKEGSPTVRCGWEAPELIVVTVVAPGGTAVRRYAWNDDAQRWEHEDAELFAELRDILFALYPESAPS